MCISRPQEVSWDFEGFDNADQSPIHDVLPALYHPGIILMLWHEDVDVHMAYNIMLNVHHYAANQFGKS